MVVATTLWRAFDKTVRRKPLAFAADAVYGNSIGLELEVIAKKEVARKALLLMFVDVLLLAFTPMIVRRGSASFKRRHLHPYTRQRPPRKRLRSNALVGIDRRVTGMPPWLRWIEPAECLGLFASTQNEDPSELQLTVRESRSRGSGALLGVREGSMLPKTL